MAEETRRDTPSPAPASVPASGEDRVGALARRAIAANARLNAIALVTVVGLILLGLWVHGGIRHSLETLRATAFQTMLDAQVKALRLWAADGKAFAETWARDERVRARVTALVAVARKSGGDGKALWSAPARAELDAILTPALQETDADAYNAVTPDGRIVATPVPGYIGRTVDPVRFLPRLADVFRGSARFVRPSLDRDRIEGTAGDSKRIAVWFEAPVRDASGTVVAALGFSHPADGQFANILEVVRPGATGEVYAFDEQGAMLSESRFAAEARHAGLAAGGRVLVRDPGGDPVAGYRPALEAAARPLTRLAALAVASRDKPEVTERQGVILEPYRNYRGVEVIGAWKWLADMEMGLAIEVEAAEAFAPLRYLNLASALILAMLLAAAAAALWSAFIVQRLRRQVGEARLIGQYRLERQIGEGGMGKVYLARHALLKRPTALKMLKPHLASDEIVARFEREVQLASQLTHPSTIEIYDYGRTPDGVFYYVMEYLDGQTLDRVVAEHGPLPVGRVLHVLKQVCAALREAHGRGLVHRDIKPQNIMLCRRGGEYDLVKILDFGLVKDTGGRQSRNISQFQKMLGTPLYMSPERIRNPADADARADIYSVGATGFYLLTGRELFESGGEHDTVYHVLHTSPRRVSELVGAIPRRLDDLVARCLEKDRGERPHDVLVVLALLEALSVDHPWTQRDAVKWWPDRAAA